MRERDVWDAQCHTAGLEIKVSEEW
jgi:hypothetical protein